MEKKILNAYEVLELDPYHSNIEQIKQAYRLKAKQFHPDTYIDLKDKKEAEKKFKVIKEAYDYLISIKIDATWNNEQNNEEGNNENFSSFFDKTGFFDDEYDDFYYQQQELDKKFENIQKKAINTIEKEIYNRNMHIIKVFELIKNNKIILTWEPGAISSEMLYDFLVKENLYRRYIKNTNAYQGYLKNQNFFANLDNYATLTINPNLYRKKKFEEKVNYIIDKLCEYCDGIGCEYCNYSGHIYQNHSLNIKVPINKIKKYYEINNGGNHSNIINGKLILTVKLNYHLNKPYIFKLKNNKSMNKLIPIFDVFHNLKIWWINCWNWIINHKHISFLYFIIVLLLITIICLAVLL